MDIHHNKDQGGYKPVDLRSRRPQHDDNWPYRNHPNTGNDPQYGIKNPKFERHVFISRDSVMFAVDAQIQMVAESRRKEDGSEDDRLTNATTKHQQMFYSWFNTHIGKAKSTMSAFVLEKFKTTKMNNISQKEEIDITLLMPEWYDDTVFDQLCDAVNDYIVNAILYEYFLLTLSIKDPVTAAKQELMNEELSNIRKYVNASKPGAIRKPYNPF